jgi:hypothetical protein
LLFIALIAALTAAASRFEILSKHGSGALLFESHEVKMRQRAEQVGAERPHRPHVKHHSTEVGQ